MVTVYGIPNCDKCRSALRWFKSHDIDHRFHDLREDGLSASLIKRWLKQVETDDLLNRRSTTWRNLGESERATSSIAGIVDLMQKYPTLIKRPIVDDSQTLIVGYDESRWKQCFRKPA